MADYDWPLAPPPTPVGPGGGAGSGYAPSGGFSTGPFGGFPWGGEVVNAEEVRSPLSSSRSMSFQDGRYNINAEGGFDGMDDVAQTVALTVAYAYKPPPTITPQNEAKSRRAIENALAHLSRGNDPLIADVRVSFRASPAGTQRPIVTYRNLRTNTRQTVEPRA